MLFDPGLNIVEYYLLLKTLVFVRGSFLFNLIAPSFLNQQARTIGREASVWTQRFLFLCGSPPVQEISYMQRLSLHSKLIKRSIAYTLLIYFILLQQFHLVNECVKVELCWFLIFNFILTQNDNFLVITFIFTLLSFEHFNGNSRRYVVISSIPSFEETKHRRKL